jgi:DNA polymerase/3'-5' exonuclease PolX
MRSKLLGGRRVSQEEAPMIVEAFLSDLGLPCITYHFGGGVFRGLPECDKIDLVLICLDPKKMPELMKAIKKVFGRYKGKDQPRLYGIYNGIQFNLHPCTIEHLGITMLQAGGSWQFIKFLKARARAKGWKLMKYGLFDSHTGKPVLQSVDEVYYPAALGLQFVQWENRSEGCEFEFRSLTDPTRMCKCRLVKDGWEVVG